MPEPAKGEKRSKYVSRCTSVRQHEHPDEDVKQSVAVCYEMWRKAKGQKQR